MPPRFLAGVGERRLAPLTLGRCGWGNGKGWRTLVPGTQDPRLKQVPALPKLLVQLIVNGRAEAIRAQGVRGRREGRRCLRVEHLALSQSQPRWPFRSSYQASPSLRA